MNTKNLKTERNKKIFKKLFAVTQNERGAALVMAVLFLVLLALLIPPIIQRTTLDTKQTKTYVAEKEAFYLADAALEHAKSEAKQVNFNEFLDGNATQTFVNINSGSTFVWDTVTYSDQAFGNGAYYVRMYNNDEDGNGLFDDTIDDDDLVYLDSWGILGNTVKHVQSFVRKKNANPSDFPAAVTLVGPTSSVHGQGAAYDVTGDAVDMNGDPDASCADTPGVSTESTAGNTAVTGNTSGITGVNGGDDVTHGQNTFTYEDALDLYNSLQPDATNITSGGTQTIINSNVIGTVANPTVTYISNDAKINGNVTGSGILIVDGDLDISGNLEFDGIIIIGACPTCTGELKGTGNATIRGAMVSGNGVSGAANFTGSSSISYSCESILNVASAFSNTFKVLNWNEIDS